MKEIINLIRHLFTPNENNNFKAKALHVDFLSYYLIFALILVFSLKNVNLYFDNVLGYATDITTNKLLELTNKERARDKLPPLEYNEKLSVAAEKKAKDMFTKNYWSHYGPTGSTPWDFILAADYEYEYAGENLAKNFLFSQGVVEAWMNSKTHRENILRREYSQVGFAIVNGVLNGEETTLVVQMFAKPLDSNLIKKTAQLPQSNTSMNSGKVLPAETEKNKLNLTKFSFNTTVIFLVFFIAVLITDFYIATKMKIIRVDGKHIAHFIFLSFILLSILLIIKKGAIL